MKRNITILSALVLISTATISQNITTDKFGNGITLMTQDSSFKLKSAMRFQNLFVYEAPVNNDGIDFSVGETNWLIRRARFKFDGYAYSPKLEYKIEIGLTNRDVSGGGQYTSNTPRLILDAVAKWNFKGNWWLWIGQTKLPGNRERVISSANLQFVDRSLVNSRYNIDRDFGLQLRHSIKAGNMVFREMAALSQGEGRDITSGNFGGHDYTFRLEWLPMGNFESKGDYVGSAIKREETPKLAIGATYDYHDKAVRERGQLGNYIIDNTILEKDEFQSLSSIMIDMMFKYKGLSVMAEYVDKTTTEGSPVVRDTLGNSFTYRTGSGLNIQAGYLCKNNWEIAGRLTWIDPRYQTGFSDERQYTIGVNKFIVGHKLKVQTDITYTEKRAQGNNFYSGNGFMHRVQMDIHF